MHFQVRFFFFHFIFLTLVQYPLMLIIGIMLPPVPIIKDLYEMLNTGGSNAVEFMDIGGISLVVELLSKLFKL